MVNERVRFSGIQMSVVVGDKSATIDKAITLIDQAVREFSPNIVALPELFATEYFPPCSHPKYFAYAEPIPGPTTEVLAKKAREHGLYVIAGIFERAARGLYYDSSAVIGPDRTIVGLTRKVELPNVYVKDRGAMVDEEFFFASADPEHAYPVIRTPYGNIGQIICYNRHFPETWRMLAINGADIIYVPVAVPAREMFVIETQVMAYQQQCFAAAINRVGIEAGEPTFGTSHIVNPSGKIIAGPASETDDEILHAVLNLREIDEAREALPFIKSFHSSTSKTLMATKQFFREAGGSPIGFIV